MGILDQIAGQVIGHLGQPGEPAPPDTLLGSIGGLIAASGGLRSVLDKLTQSGLHDEVASWIGTQENRLVSGAQIQHALGDGHLAAIAQQAGMTPEHAAAGLARFLPQLTDQLTPGGQLPHDSDWLQQGLAVLVRKGLAG